MTAYAAHEKRAAAPDGAAARMGRRHHAGAEVVFAPQRMPPIAPLMTIITNCCSGIFLPLKSTWPSA